MVGGGKRVIHSGDMAGFRLLSLIHTRQEHAANGLACLSTLCSKENPFTNKKTPQLNDTNLHYGILRQFNLNWLFDVENWTYCAIIYV